MPTNVLLDQIEELYQGYAKKWNITMSISGVTPAADDTVSLILLSEIGDAEEDAVLKKDADSKTISGTSLSAIFVITSSDTAEIDPGQYYLEVRWVNGGNPYRVFGKDIVVHQSGFKNN
jgi:hypothetical protein